MSELLRFQSAISQMHQVIIRILSRYVSNKVLASIHAQKQTIQVEKEIYSVASEQGSSTIINTGSALPKNNSVNIYVIVSQMLIVIKTFQVSDLQDQRVHRNL